MSKKSSGDFLEDKRFTPKTRVQLAAKLGISTRIMQDLLNFMAFKVIFAFLIVATIASSQTIEQKGQGTVINFDNVKMEMLYLCNGLWITL